jgi:hypothetical protein
LYHTETHSGEDSNLTSTDIDLRLCRLAYRMCLHMVFVKLAHFEHPRPRGRSSIVIHIGSVAAGPIGHLPILRRVPCSHPSMITRAFV